MLLAQHSNSVLSAKEAFISLHEEDRSSVFVFLLSLYCVTLQVQIDISLMELSLSTSFIELEFFLISLHVLYTCN